MNTNTYIANALDDCTTRVNATVDDLRKTLDAMPALELQPVVLEGSKPKYNPLKDPALYMASFGLGALAFGLLAKFF